ncbi:MAG: NAD(P)-dependent oxidoreductase [Betaproteobacteria bacterium]
MKKIGLIGLGRMGHAMVKRLISQGVEELYVWDRDTAKIKTAKDAGALPAANASDVVTKSDITLVMINDDAGAQVLYSGKDGIASGATKDKLIIEMSTLQPQTLQTLSALLESKGAKLIGVPMMGSIPTVLEGQLFLPAGGHAADIERAMPVLQLISRKVKHVGGVGQAHAMKLAVNLTMAAYLQALAEGMALGTAQGLKIEDMLEIFAQAPTANGWLNMKTAVLKGGASDTTLDISSLRKDMLNAVAAGSLAGVPMTMASAIATSLSGAVSSGIGGEDLAQFPKFFREHLIQKPA